jgi:hypothetical protein
VREATVQGIRVCFRAQADEKIDVSQVRKQYQQDQLRQILAAGCGKAPFQTRC